MATKLKRPTQKSSVVKAVTPVAPVEVEPIIVPENIEVVPEVIAEDSNAAATKKRQKNNFIPIAPARVRRHMDAMGVNKIIDIPINKLKDELDELKFAQATLESGTITEQVVDATTKVVTPTTRPITEVERATFTVTIDKLGSFKASHEEEIASLSRERIRFSNNTADTVAIICSEALKQLIKHATDQVLLDKRKIIQIVHVHYGNVGTIPLYPLIAPLPSFMKRHSAVRAQLDEEAFKKRVNDAVVQSEKVWKKKHGIVNPKKKPVPAAEKPATPAPVVVEKAAPVAPEPKKKPVVAADDSDSEDGESKTSFRTYIKKVCNIANADRNEKVNISNEVKEYLSDLVVELIARLATQSRHLTETIGNKTINEETVMRAVEMILIDGKLPIESLTTSDETSPALLAIEQRKKKTDPTYTFDKASIPLTSKTSRVLIFKDSYYPTLRKIVTETLKSCEAAAL